MDETITMDVGSALFSLVPNAIWSVQDGVLKWNDDNITQPTEAEIDAEIIRLQAEYDSQEYARKRKAEYDALNQLEMQYDDEEDGTTTWKDAIAAIKTKYPKV